MRKTIAGLLLWAAPLIFSPQALAQGERCGTHMANPAPVTPGTGGVHCTSSGTLRVLIVFVSFHDDDTPHANWPAHQPPLFMSQFIDPDTTVRTQSSFNLTRYFREMSLGQFHLIGESMWLESALSRYTYVNSGSYGLANWNALHEIDPAVDFSLYDNWRSAGDRQHINAPDSVVDMIIMVWRTTVFQVIGEASLGYKPGFLADGKWIELGYPERFDYPRGSGVTCEYPYGEDPERVMRTMAHEVGHWLLGGPHPYNGGSTGGKSQFWSILCSGERFSSCVNAYEREQLGWGMVPELPADTVVRLPDYLTTGAAYKVPLLNGEAEETFYIENHQLLSPFDDVTRNRADRGVWILHRIGPYAELDRLRIRPSDGGWVWESPATTSACYGQELPLFRKAAPYVPFGLTHRDQIPTIARGVNWVYVFLGAGDELRCAAAASGEGFTGAFAPGSSPVFSPFSNPSSHTRLGAFTGIGVEVLSDSGGVVALRRASDPVSLPPARRHLGIDPTVQDVVPEEIPMAWGAEWTEGPELEPDVEWSELQRKVGDSGGWGTVYEGPATAWRETTIVRLPGGVTTVEYRARVRDTSGHSSAWSPVIRFGTTITGVEREADLPAETILEPGYPNPFNSSALFRYRLAAPARVDLRVFDMLGREVLLLEEGVRGAGVHTVRFPASGLASGSYAVRLRADGLILTRRILLLR